MNKIVNGKLVSMTEAETALLKEKTDAREAYEKSNGYKSNRAAKYPSIVDQLDQIYHEGLDAWKATIKTTKDEFPKP
tara:strand:+ start:122 stop:352 length:231 start_codon:yes stop_codon:yes gene_type:complete